jgi:hypothetical protein
VNQLGVGRPVRKVWRYATVLLVMFLGELGALGAVALCGATDPGFRAGGGLLAGGAGGLCLLVVRYVLPARWPNRPWWP